MVRRRCNQSDGPGEFREVNSELRTNRPESPTVGPKAGFARTRTGLTRRSAESWTVSATHTSSHCWRIETHKTHPGCDHATGAFTGTLPVLTWLSLAMAARQQCQAPFRHAFEIYASMIIQPRLPSMEYSFCLCPALKTQSAWMRLGSLASKFSGPDCDIGVEF